MLSKLKSLFTADNSAAPLRQINGYALYEFGSCPYCFRVRVAIKKLGINIESRNVHKSQKFAAELVREGGRSMTPCLRIEDESGVRWMYESSDIIAHLKGKFS